MKTPGQTTITVTATYTNSAGVTSVYEDSFVLTVFLDSTNSISFKIANRPLNDSIAYGYTATLEIESDFHTEYINWESQNGAVATISSNGVITAVQNGSTVITATVTVNNNNYTDSFVLTVKDSIFEDNDKFDDEDVKSKALDKMNWYYYNNKEEIQGVVNGTDSDCDTCIFAFEGLGEGFGGITEENQISAPYSYHKLPYNFLNAMMVVTKGNKIEYVTRRASTLPDNRPNNYPGEGITTMHSGVYEYKQGWHGGYAALVPIYPVYPDGFGKPNKLPGWYKDTNDNFYSDGCAGTNIHASGLNPAIGELANSEGCQLVYTSDYFDFGVQVGFLNSYPDDSAPTSSISDNMPIIIGKNSSFVNKDSDIKVKYILNRDYDEKNKTYQNNPSSDCNNGIFYPINHEICHEKCIFCK